MRHGTQRKAFTVTPNIDVIRLTQLLDRMDPTASPACTVAGCVHHHSQLTVKGDSPPWEAIAA